MADVGPSTGCAAGEPTKLIAQVWVRTVSQQQMDYFFACGEMKSSAPPITQAVHVHSSLKQHCYCARIAPLCRNMQK
jgi:hypothetical protein